jgi:protoporphyrinogen oxidase
MLGLTLALRLQEQGAEVTLLEAAPTVGGLASAWTIDTPDGPVTWDRHYHVTLLSDRATRSVLDAAGVAGDLRWVETQTGYYADGRLSPVSSSIDFLRLPALSPVAKVRLAATILAGSRIRNWRALEQQTVRTWLTRWSGESTFRRFWLPLLRAKLGESWSDTNAAFIWATIQRLYAARRTGLKKEMFGYVPGGYAHVLDRLAHRLAEQGVKLRTGAAVERIEAAAAGGLDVRVEGAPAEHFDRVAVTTTPDLADRMCADLTDAERAVLRAIPYQGIVCASVVLRRPLSPYYLTYLLDDLPFTAVVEKTAFVDPAEVGGHTLVYLPKYVAPDDPIFEEPDASLRERFLAGLRRVHPELAPDDVLAFRVSRVRRVFPVPTLGYSQHVPPRDTSVPGLHLVGSAQIVNGTLNVNETVQLADAAAAALAVRPAGGGGR